jgi:hypothetical protein
MAYEILSGANTVRNEDNFECQDMKYKENV